MQALLLDNEAAGEDFGVAAWADILRRYVTPYGVALAGEETLPAVQGFSVDSGSSCWQAVSRFARYYGGRTPRFDRGGRFDVSPLPGGVTWKLEESAPVTELALTHTRYGVLSEVRVVNQVTRASQTVRNEDFAGRGGRASRVLTMPRHTGYEALRFNGRYQLDASARDLTLLCVTLAAYTAVFPGALIEAARTKTAAAAYNGVWRVRETRLRLTEDGLETRLILGKG
jgi:hypothetical protein